MSFIRLNDDLVILFTAIASAIVVPIYVRRTLVRLFQARALKHGEVQKCGYRRAPKRRIAIPQKRVVIRKKRPLFKSNDLPDSGVRISFSVSPTSDFKEAVPPTICPKNLDFITFCLDGDGSLGTPYNGERCVSLLGFENIGAAKEAFVAIPEIERRATGFYVKTPCFVTKSGEKIPLDVYRFEGLRLFHWMCEKWETANMQSTPCRHCAMIDWEEYHAPAFRCPFVRINWDKSNQFLSFGKRNGKLWTFDKPAMKDFVNSVIKGRVGNCRNLIGIVDAVINCIPDNVTSGNGWLFNKMFVYPIPTRKEVLRISRSAYASLGAKMPKGFIARVSEADFFTSVVKGDSIERMLIRSGKA